MGQLERYGLYVLCLVIFLILGVAIWGGDPAAAAAPGAGGAAIRADAGGGGEPGPGPGANHQPGADPFFGVDDGRDEVLAGMRPADDAGGGGDAPGPQQGGEPPQPQPQPTPEPKERTHTVQGGDSFASVSKQYYGSEAHIRALQRANPGVRATALKIGSTLRIPALETGEKGAKAAKQPAARTYKVRRGDSPSSIALKHYGTTKHADKIMAANRISDPTKLKIGSTIVLPRID